jgi:hypothetical protein
VHDGKTLLYRASKLDCDVCPLKPQCCPKEPARKIPRDIHEHARDVARSFADTEAFDQSRRERKKIEMRFAHLKRILKLGRLRLRGPRGAQDEFVLAAIAQNLRRHASLVPGDPVVNITDRDVAVTGVYQKRRRMTLTYPVLNRSRGILWLVTGPEKAEILQRLVSGDESIPAGRIQRDTAVVLADRAAASDISATETKGI